ncbi:MAG: hypothetical protein IPG77_14160 [Betaproteobacteria bacterium]|nr:hypothetical protein [Betaproteobacteria bacterium]
MRKASFASKFLHATPARFTGRLAAMNEMWRWRWSTCGPGNESTIFSWIGDVEMRCAVGFQVDQYPLVKVAGNTWDATELWSCEYWVWRCHVLNTRGARASDLEFFRVAWICLDLPMAHDAPQPGEPNVCRTSTA